MSFQTIFNISESIGVQNRRTVGQQVSRSGQVRVAQYLTSVPWNFVVKPNNYLFYPQVRDVIQVIDNYDRQIPQTITFAGSGLSWFTAYQGGLTSLQAATLTLASVPAANATTISVGNLPSVATTAVVFAAGDFLQLGIYSYKVTAQVLRGSGSTVSVTLHRPVIGTPSTGTLTAVGSACTFYLLAAQCPTYTLNPMTNGAFVEWDAEFVFIEDITG
ncbi:hypothetical protein UFOVP306_28 [uncultured Caudovirales phage]|uniref:Uncharacterized protein n=1 Tax=uncultured Caudovirales phage TaxID=2100421 RepID=A0A6J5LXT1_9CAUD|nr:hypothetical protein UFOVP306_28 [uncultured Caudovirales phage]